MNKIKKSPKNKQILRVIVLFKKDGFCESVSITLINKGFFVLEIKIKNFSKNFQKKYAIKSEQNLGICIDQKSKQ